MGQLKTWGGFLAFALTLAIGSAPLLAQEPLPKNAFGVKAVPASRRLASVMDEDSAFYHYQFNTSLGMTIFHGTAFTIGEQFGFAPINDVPLYFGPAINFSLYSPGYLLSTLGGGWYEIRIHGVPRLSIAMGVLAGAGFTKSLIGVKNVALEGFLDGAIIQEIDDLFSVRGEFRPGVVDGYFAFMMNFNVSFRFR